MKNDSEMGLVDWWGQVIQVRILFFNWVGQARCLVTCYICSVWYGMVVGAEITLIEMQVKTELPSCYQPHRRNAARCSPI